MIAQPTVLLSRVVAVLALATIACGQNTKLTELQRVRSGSLDVVLLSPGDGLRHGRDTFAIEFRSSGDGALVDAGEVRASATMPMPSMPMLGSITVRRTNVAGRYEADGQFEMAGTWRITIEWNGAAGKGSATIAGSVG